VSKVGLLRRKLEGLERKKEDRNLRRNLSSERLEMSCEKKKMSANRLSSVDVKKGITSRGYGTSP